MAKIRRIAEYAMTVTFATALSGAAAVTPHADPPNVPIDNAESIRIDDAFFGTWTLNLTRSTFENASAPQQGSRVHRARGHGLISIVVNTVDSEGVTHHRAFVCRLDGQDYLMMFDFRSAGETIALNQIDPFTADFAVKRGAEVIETGYLTLDRLRTVLTIETRGVAADGRQVTSIEVWEKQRGPTEEHQQ